MGLLLLRWQGPRQLLAPVSETVRRHFDLPYNVVTLGRAASSAEYFTGRLDELAVFQGSLTEDEVLAIMQDGVLGSGAVAVPALSGVGSFVLALILLAASTVILIRRRAAIAQPVSFGLRLSGGDSEIPTAASADCEGLVARLRLPLTALPSAGHHPYLATSAPSTPEVE